MSSRGIYVNWAASLGKAAAGWALFLLLAPWLRAEIPPSSGDYLISVWQTEHGLPDNSVTSIQQTPDGYLWVGTYSGLARFDGVRFVCFAPPDTPALRHPRVQALFCDAAGTLWIYTFDGSLTALRNGVFSLEHQGSGGHTHSATLVSCSNELVFASDSGARLRRPAPFEPGEWDAFDPPDGLLGHGLWPDRTGALWYLTGRHGAGRYQNGRFEPLPENCGLLGQRINCLATDAQGRVWAGTDRELAVWNGRRFESMTPTNGPAELNVESLLCTRDGGCWVGSSARLQQCRNQSWAAELGPLGELHPSGAFATVTLEDRQGDVWFGHYGRGLFRVTAEGRVQRLTTANGLPGDRVGALFEDREGNVWAGINRGGLVRLRERPFQVVGPAQGLGEAAVMSVCEDSAGRVWLGSFGGGLYRWQDGVLASLEYPSQQAGPGGYVTCLWPARDGSLWVGAQGPELGLYWLRDAGAKGQLFRRIAPVALFADSQGRLWESDSQGLGVIVNHQLKRFDKAGGYEGKDARAFAEDASGGVWIGGGDGTLYRFHEGTFSAHRPDDTPQPHPVWSLAVDPDGTIWAGTFGGGLLRWAGGRFSRATTRHGLPSDVIGQILDDGRGQLWCGSYAGIFRVAKTALRDLAQGTAATAPCVSYGRFDGLPTIQCAGNYQPSGWRARDGRLWFGTLRGAVSVQPEAVRVNPRPPPVVIEDLLVDGVSIPRPDPSGSCRIAPGRHYVELRYTGLSFCAPDKVQFKYKLEGLQEEWAPAGPRRSVSFGYLPPGAYRFRVTACNNDSVWNETGAALGFVVLPHFWQTQWFLAVVLAGAAVAGGGLVRRTGHRKLRRRLERLERERALEKERSRIAKDIHDDLGAGLTRISLLSQPASESSPGPRQTALQLAQINATTRELTRAMGEIVWAVNPAHDSLDSLSAYLGRFAQEFLSAARLRCRLDIPMQLPPWVLSADTRHNLFLAFKEALNNAAKHAAADEVRITLAVESARFVLSVEDNGRGFTPGSAEPAPGAAGSGNGLANMRHRLAEIGGECVVQSQFGLGTQVRFVVPVEALS